MAVKPTFTSSDLEGALTLQEQLERLRHYISLLRDEAKYLGNEKSGDEADELQKIIINVDETHPKASDLEAITEALLTIEKKQVIVEGDSTQGLVITVPKGYYDKDTVVEAAGTDNSTAVKDAPTLDQVVAGKDYWANGTHYTGQLTDNSGQEVSAETTDKSGETIKVTVRTAKYDDKSVIDTGITVRTQYKYDAEVQVSTDEEGAQHAKSNAISIPAGYYDKPIEVYPVFTDAGEYESVLNVKDKIIVHSGEFDPHNEKTADGNGFDYYSKITVDKAQVSDQATIDIPTATATINVTQAGYTDEDSYSVAIPAKEAPTTTDAEVNAKDATVTVTPKVDSEQSVTIPAGFYTTDTVIKVESMANGETVDGKNISVKETPSINETEDGYTVVVNVNKSGYIEAGDYEASDLSKSSVSTTNVEGKEIVASSVRISTNEGYTKGETINLNVREAIIPDEIGVTKNKIIITPTTTGWFTGKEYNLAGNVNNVVDALATTSDALFVYNDVKDVEYGKNTTKYSGGEGIYYKKAETDLTDLVTELSNL